MYIEVNIEDSRATLDLANTDTQGHTRANGPNTKLHRRAHKKKNISRIALQEERAPNLRACWKSA